ncbi:hypothetical protein, partial [Streptomyces niveiscabiei]|uniref:hypothetical protein n=1 Tax=Streptomyces niveiscabiei TaxID=164115 RepID=UPI00198093FF
MRNCLVVKGVRQNNLRDVSLGLPRNALTVFTRVSGAGKSSLAFDAIFTKGWRRYVVIGQNGASGKPHCFSERRPCPRAIGAECGTGVWG